MSFFFFFCPDPIFIVVFKSENRSGRCRNWEELLHIEDGLYDGDIDYLEGLTNDDSYSGVER